MDVYEFCKDSTAECFCHVRKLSNVVINSIISLSTDFVFLVKSNIQ